MNKILIPDGYRLVNEGEIIEATDLLIKNYTGSCELFDWEETLAGGTVMGKVGVSHSEFYPRIRKITKPVYPTKNFQVETSESLEIKNLLVELFAKQTNTDVPRSIVTNPSQTYLQFWLEEMPDGDCNGEDVSVTHNDCPYKPHLVEVVSVPEAVKRLKKIKVFKPIQIKLNNSYTAEIQKNGDVKVGCQTFDGKVIISLAEQVKKVQESN